MLTVKYLLFTPLNTQLMLIKVCLISFKSTFVFVFYTKEHS